MVLNVEFQVLYERGRSGIFYHTYQIETATRKLRDPEFYYMSEIDDIDKEQMMIENDIELIIDYNITNIEEVKIAHFNNSLPVQPQRLNKSNIDVYTYAVDISLLAGLNLSEEFLLDLKLMSDRMKNEISGLPILKQLDIVIASLYAGYEIRNVAKAEMVNHLQEIISKSDQAVEKFYLENADRIKLIADQKKSLNSKVLE